MGIIHFIVNPAAGRGRVARMIARLKGEIQESRLRYSFRITQAPGHAMDLAAEAKQEDIVIAVGGDGTVNEAVNGIMHSKATLGTIAMGSGNDFARMLNIRTGVSDISKLVNSRSTRRVDVGVVEYRRQSDGKPKTRYFVNGLGIGFDAAVSIHSRTIKYLRGLPLYLWALLRMLPRYRANHYEMHIDGAHVQKAQFLICIGNGAYEGGGFKLTPDARIDDARLDMCSIDPLSLARALAVLPSATRGTHVVLPEVQSQRICEARIIAKEPFPAHVDGEILGDDLVDITVKVEPGAVSMLDISHRNSVSKERSGSGDVV